jgi:type I restriction enzyme S subunit
LPVPLPGTAEQIEILSKLDAQIDALTVQERAVEHALKQSAAQRQNILRAAFSGQLVPQDPADEPAAVLLERIRTERTQGQSPQSRRPRRTAAPKASA